MIRLVQNISKSAFLLALTAQALAQRRNDLNLKQCSPGKILTYFYLPICLLKNVGFSFLHDFK